MISEAGAAVTTLSPGKPVSENLLCRRQYWSRNVLAGFHFQRFRCHTLLSRFTGVRPSSDNIFDGNHSEQGALVVGHGGGSITNNVFRNNRGSYQGGGMQVASWSPMLIERTRLSEILPPMAPASTRWAARYATVRNNLIVDNHATSYGGVDLSREWDAVQHTLIHNNTIVNCSSGNNGGGGICFGGCTLDTAYNNIIVGCQGNGIWAANSLDCYFDYNCLFNNSPADYKGVPVGSHEIYLDPLFVGGAPYSFNLASTSPCIDAGNPDPLFNDLDGSRNDIGAFPSLHICPEMPMEMAPSTYPTQYFCSIYIFALWAGPGANGKPATSIVTAAAISRM